MRYLWQFLGWLLGAVMVLWIVDVCWLASATTSQLPSSVDTKTTLGVIATPALTWIGLFTTIFVFLQTKMGDTRPEGERWFLIDIGIPLAIIAVALVVIFSWAGNDLFAFVGLPTPARTPTASEAVYLFGFAASLEFLNVLLRSFRRTRATPAMHATEPAAAEGGVPVYRPRVGHVEPLITVSAPRAVHVDDFVGGDSFIAHGRLIEGETAGKSAEPPSTST